MSHLSPSDCVFQRGSDLTCSGAGYPIKNVLLSSGMAPMMTCNAGDKSYSGRVSDLFAGSVGVPLGLVVLEGKCAGTREIARDTDCQPIPESLFASLIDMARTVKGAHRHTRRKPASRGSRQTRRA